MRRLRSDLRDGTVLASLDLHELGEQNLVVLVDRRVPLAGLELVHLLFFLVQLLHGFAHLLGLLNIWDVLAMSVKPRLLDLLQLR